MMDNLAADMIQCRMDGYGCHYGKWKALQPVGQIKRRTPEAFDDGRRVCENCGAVFFHYGSGAMRFCSVSCRKTAYYENNKQRFKDAYQRRKAERMAVNGQGEDSGHE